MVNSEYHSYNKTKVIKNNCSIKVNTALDINQAVSKDRENIFIKDEQLKAIKAHSHIKKSKTLLSFYFIIILAVLLIFLLEFEAKV